MEPAALEAAISPRTKVIMPVHYGGLACDMDSILAVSRSHGIKVVEDAAHALPTTYRSKMIGTLDSDATVFSFYANKTMTTGEGGMIVTRSPELASRMRVMRLHGIDRDAFNRFRSEKPGWYYEVVAPGYKYNLTDIASSLGLVQLRRLPKFAARREELAQRYHRELAHLPLVLPAKAAPGDAHSWHLYVIRLTDDAVRSGKSRDQVIEELGARGIGTSVHYVPLHRQPYWRDRDKLTPQQFPSTETAFERMISIPLYTKMTDGDQGRVIAALKEIFT
jgi:dTDP-4-amino-4,6-dideoxygalactose transaminase